ncbi:TonB-dependent hemoglobin/transferrin/lactoferrin family receptor [Terrihabitans sp. B22-R8]|uniref:TonB-dependent hemoglobin/transferrin/lactoferrin family receptor n=1 Tax=Terrihabitans sp. B22-R8 TaxID=3425128 RepID=UPI00403C7BB0
MYRTSLYASVALMALAIATSAQAQNADQEPGIQLETITVDGARGDGDGMASDVPTERETVLTTRVERAEIDDRQVTDIRDIDRLAPGVSYDRTSRSFNVRGLDRSRVLTTIDGIRVPWIEDGARGLTGGVNSFEFDSLSSVDIAKGSDSTVFGTGALGGAVALRTLDPEDLIKPGRNWGAITRSGFDSADDSWRVDQAAALRVGETFMLVQGGYRNGHELDNKGELDVYGATRTAANPSDYDQENLLVKLHHYADGGHRFGFTGELFNRDENIDNRLGTTLPTYRPGSVTTDEAIKRQRISADYRYDGGGVIDQASAIVYWQRQQLDTEFNGFREGASRPFGDYRRLTEREEERIGTTGSALSIVDIGGTEHRIGFGGELFASKASSFSSGQDNCLPPPYPPFAACSFLHTNQADMPEVEGTTFGAFIEDEIGLMGGRLRVTPGVRFDWYEERPQETAGLDENPTYDGSLPPNSSDSAFSGKLRIEYDVETDVTVYAQWAQAFRAPTANELYLTYGGSGTYLRVGNEDLKPETSNGFDVGVKLGDSDFGGSVGAFYNRYENFITTVGMTDAEYGMPGAYPQGVTQTVNLNNVEIYGTEIAAHYRHESGFRTWGNLGVYVGEDLDTGIGLNTIPAARVQVAVGYQASHWGSDLIMTAAASRDFEGNFLPPTRPGGPVTAVPVAGSDVSNQTSATPGYALLDLTAWWQPHFVEGLTLRAGVFNILDKTYYKTLDITALNKGYYSEPGRNFKVSATYQF